MGFDFLFSVDVVVFCGEFEVDALVFLSTCIGSVVEIAESTLILNSKSFFRFVFEMFDIVATVMSTSMLQLNC